MKITRATLNDAEAVQLKTAQENKSKRSQPSNADAASANDNSVKISALARELGAFDTLPPDQVRSEKVAELKAKIEAGEYKVDSEVLARKVIEDLVF